MLPPCAASIIGDFSMASTPLPLIADYRPERIFAWRDGRAVSTGQALAEIRAVAEHLPEDSACVILCEDRYLFTIALAAGALARTLSLLPQSRAPATLARVRDDYADAMLIGDADVSRWCGDAESAQIATSPTVPAQQPLAVVFTSGSTGRPDPNIKYWGDLVTGSALMRRRFFPEADGVNLVATVPPQHMYGLETSVLTALHIGFAADSERPFMPWSVAGALARLPEPRVLVTTPVHLRACLAAEVAMPDLRRIISATAPLDAQLAADAEAKWQAPVCEIFGSSETGSIASRRTTASDVWQLYDGVTLFENHGLYAYGGHLPSPVLLSDRLHLLGDGYFRLVGRATDMLKVGGKRMSLADLSAELLAINGVDDGVAFADPEAPERERPVALAVSATLSARTIAARLARRIDPVFVPRPLMRVTSLPRNSLGKLPREALARAWTEARRRQASV